MKRRETQRFTSSFAKVLVKDSEVKSLHVGDGEDEGDVVISGRWGGSLGRERPQERVERRSRLTRRRPARSQAKRTVAQIRGGGEGRSSPAVTNQPPWSKEFTL